MGFPVFTAISAVAGIGQSIAGSMSANAAADAANKADRRAYRLETARNFAQYELNNLADQTQYAWDQARVAQLRANEATNKADQQAYGKRMIAQAIDNLRLNSQALEDKFITEEALRGEQVGINYAYEAVVANQETNELVRQYMSQINDRAIQAEIAVNERVNKTGELMSSLAYDEQRDQMKFWMEEIAITAQSARDEAVATAQQGGGATSQRLAMEGVKELGRKFGEIEQRSQNRRAKVGLANAAFSSETALLQSRAAIQTQDLRDRVAFSAKKFGIDSDNRAEVMSKLAIPTFDLAKRQYSRELESLQLQTKNTMDNALQPYREQTFLDPMKPIAGLAPMSVAPTPRAKSSLGSMVSGALFGGLEAGMKAYQFDRALAQDARDRGERDTKDGMNRVQF